MEIIQKYEFELYSGEKVIFNCSDSDVPVEKTELKENLFKMLDDCHVLGEYYYAVHRKDRPSVLKSDMQSYVLDTYKNYIQNYVIKFLRSTDQNPKIANKLADEILADYLHDMVNLNNLFLDLDYNGNYICTLKFDKTKEYETDINSDLFTTLRVFLQDFYTVYCDFSSLSANPDYFIENYYDKIEYSICAWLKNNGYNESLYKGIDFLAPMVLQTLNPSYKGLFRLVKDSDRKDSFADFKNYYYPQGYLEDKIQAYTSDAYWYNSCWSLLKSIHFVNQFTHILIDTETTWTPKQAIMNSTEEFLKYLDSNLFINLKFYGQDKLAEKMASEALEANKMYLEKCGKILEGDYSNTTSEPSKIQEEKVKKTKTKSIKEKKQEKTSKKSSKKLPKKSLEFLTVDDEDVQEDIELYGVSGALKKYEQLLEQYSGSDSEDAQILVEDTQRKIMVLKKSKSDTKAKKFEKSKKSKDKVSKQIKAALPNSTEEARQRIQNLVDTINSIPDPNQLQSFLNRTLGCNGGTVKDNIEVDFDTIKSVASEDIKPVLEQIKPWYDLLMSLKNMKLTDLNSVITVVTQLVSLQFAPFIQKFNQFSSVVNNITSLTGEINILANAITRKASEFGLNVNMSIPDIPTLPVLGSIPFSFSPGGGSTSPSIGLPTEFEYSSGDGMQYLYTYTSNYNLKFPDIKNVEDIKTSRLDKDLFLDFSSGQNDFLILKNFYKNPTEETTDFGDLKINNVKLSEILKKSENDTQS